MFFFYLDPFVCTGLFSTLVYLMKNFMTVTVTVSLHRRGPLWWNGNMQYGGRNAYDRVPTLSPNHFLFMQTPSNTQLSYLISPTTKQLQIIKTFYVKIFKNLWQRCRHGSWWERWMCKGGVRGPSLSQLSAWLREREYLYINIHILLQLYLSISIYLYLYLYKCIYLYNMWRVIL